MAVAGARDTRKPRIVTDEGSTIRRPLDGVRVLALEQLQSLPVATQLMVHLGADVIKIEPPETGEPGRATLPSITDNSGRPAGARFLRYGLGKRSAAIDLATLQGRDLVRAMAAAVDVVCENLGPGVADDLGVGYAALNDVNPRIIYASLSGFGAADDSPYAHWPDPAVVPEAMSGVYEYSRRPHQPPVLNPMGDSADTTAGLFALVGILAAIRHRDRMGLGQRVDVSKFDSMISMCDLVPNYWSLGVRRDPDEDLRLPLINTAFKASDGWFMMSVFRRHQFERLAHLIDRPEWCSDSRFDDPWGWADNLAGTIRPAVEAWASSLSKHQASSTLAQSGIAAAPGNSAVDLVDDAHVVAHRMLTAIPRSDGVPQPVLVAGNPIKMSRLDEDAGLGLPSVGQHTDEVLSELLGLDHASIGALRRDGAIG